MRSTIVDDSRIMFIEALKYAIYRWLSAIIIVLLLNTAIGWAMSASVSTDVDLYEAIQFTSNAGALIYALIALGAIIACGFTIQAGIVSVILVTYLATLSGATLATAIYPSIIFQVILAMVGLLASFQIVRGLYAHFSPDSLEPQPTVPTIIFYGCIIVLIFLLCSHTFHDLVYPLLFSY